MAKRFHRLSARAVATATKPGRHADGGNLYLAITKAGAKRWVFLYEYHGKQREAGLGSVAAVTLAEARTRAAEYRSQLAKDIDPLAAKEAATSAAATPPGAPPFGQCADMLFAARRAAWSETHAQQWQSSVKTYCASILATPIDQVDRQTVLACLQPIWLVKPETAQRLRARIEDILDFANAHHWRGNDNPARFKALSYVLPRRQKLEKQHFAAMDFRRLPEFVAHLRTMDTVTALALEYLILTATRSAEGREARWQEISDDVWIIPARRMKAGVEFRVPLSRRALEIVEIMRARRTAGSEFVFPSRVRGRPISDLPLRHLLPSGSSLHGFRSAFRDFLGEETTFPRELAEQCLAHAVGNAVEQAYRRGDALEKRRAVMKAWAQYCDGPTAGKVVSIDRKKR